MEGAANYQMSYVQPASELIQEGDHDTLVLNLPGFKKELLKAELTSESRILKISGATQLEDKRWIGFDKDFPVLPNCDIQKISARFDNSKLFVTMPKLISLAEKEDGKLQPLETRKPQKPTEEPFDAPEKNGERASQKKTARQKMNIVLFVLLAFLVGLYVSNLVWYSKKAEN